MKQTNQCKKLSLNEKDINFSGLYKSIRTGIKYSEIQLCLLVMFVKFFCRENFLFDSFDNQLIKFGIIVVFFFIYQLRKISSQTLAE